MVSAAYLALTLSI